MTVSSTAQALTEFNLAADPPAEVIPAVSAQRSLQFPPPTSRGVSGTFRLHSACVRHSVCPQRFVFTLVGRRVSLWAFLQSQAFLLFYPQVLADCCNEPDCLTRRGASCREASARPTAAIPMGNPYCSSTLQLQFLWGTPTAALR